MSGKVSGHVWDLDLPANRRLVLLAYTDHADHLGENMWPSVGLIAWKTGYSERQVKRITKQLVNDDKILIEVGRGKNGVKRYKLDWNAGIQKEPYSRDNMSPEVAQSKPGDNMSPEASNKRSDILTPKGNPAEESDILSAGGDILSKQSDTQMSPEPSLEPPLEPSLEPPESTGVSLERAQLIVGLPTHMRNFELQNMPSHPIIDGYSEAIGAPHIATDHQKLAALRAQILGYTKEDVKKLTAAKLKEGKGKYPFSWMINDLATYRSEVMKKSREDRLGEDGRTRLTDSHEDFAARLAQSPYAKYFANFN
jgi:hypothetical protein